MCSKLLHISWGLTALLALHLKRAVAFSAGFMLDRDRPQVQNQAASAVLAFRPDPNNWLPALVRVLNDVGSPTLALGR